MGSKSKILQTLASGATGLKQVLQEVHAHKPAALVSFNPVGDHTQLPQKIAASEHAGRQGAGGRHCP